MFNVTMKKQVVRVTEVEPQSDHLAQTQKQLDHFAWLMDQCFRVPGLGWRFGLEAIIGLFPGAGDLVTGALGLLLLVRALQFNLPKIVVARMVLNTLIDVVVGAIPLLGDAFDFVWKSNTRNMKLFHQHASEPELSTRKHWIFIAALLGGFFFIFLLIAAFFVYLIFRFYQG